MASKRRTTELTAAALVGAALLSLSCGERESRPLRFWALGREGEEVQKVLGDFRREHPGLKIGRAHV